MGSLSIRNVSFAYQGGSQPAVSGVNLEVQEGEIISFIGPSGCGKSTVLNMLAGLLLPTEGEIWCNKQKIAGPSLERGVVFQSYSLFPWMTAQQNILLALRQVYKKASKHDLLLKAKDLLDIVGLSDAAGKFPTQLSGGMQQRVALARMFAVDSPVFLMDEPFGAVDAAVRANLQDCLMSLWNGQEVKKTVVMVTHDIDEAILLSDRIIVFTQSPGRIIEQITVDITRPRKRSALFRTSSYIELRAHLLTLLNGEESEELEKKVVS